MGIILVGASCVSSSNSNIADTRYNGLVQVCSGDLQRRPQQVRRGQEEHLPVSGANPARVAAAHPRGGDTTLISFEHYLLFIMPSEILYRIDMFNSFLEETLTSVFLVKS